MTDTLQKAYQAFDPSPLTVEDDQLYVDLDEVRGDADVVARLEQRIRLDLGRHTCQLVAGHRGCGKSTELRRLQRSLETGEPRIFTIFVEALEDVDPNDVDFPEVLIAVVRQLAQQVRQREHIKLSPGYFKKRFGEFKDLLNSEVSLEAVEFDVGLAKFSSAIKASPDARREVRKALEPDTNNLLAAANDVIGQAMLELDKKGYGGLAIIIDDLDKMVHRPHESAGCSSDEHLFVHRHDQLTGFDCHTVYSMPISLAYSSAERKIATLYGGGPRVISMVKVRTRPPARKPHKPGIEKLREVISRRLQHAGLEDEAVFDDKTSDRLIDLSGGQPRELMILIREALVGKGVPITTFAVDRAAGEGRRAYARQLRDDHQAILQAAHKTGKLERTKGSEETIRDLLDSRALLQYVNDEEWYGVNPLIELPKAAKRRKTAPPKPKTRKATALRKK